MKSEVEANPSKPIEPANETRPSLVEAVEGGPIGAAVDASLGLCVGLAVGATVAAHAVVISEIDAKPSRHTHEYV